MLPTFLIIGAMKCGTTSLYSYLQSHPEVSVSCEKEPNFFLERSDKSLEEYRSLFRGNARAYGEASTGYTKHPYMKTDISRMHDLLPDAKLIYLVRDPVERMISHFLDNASRGVERRTLREVLEVSFDENNYVHCSRYYTQLEKYLQHYPIRQILVLPSGRLKRDRRTALAQVFEFIGVDSSYYTPEYEEEHHQTNTKDVSYPLARRLAGTSAVQWIKQALPTSLTELLREAVKRPVRRPDLPSEYKDRLTAYFQGEVDRLRDETGLSLSNWSV